MDTKFQTSFIPKKPIIMTANAPIAVKKPINFISVISTIIFMLAVLATAGVFVYERYLNTSIDKMESDLAAARSSFESGLLNDFVRLDSRIKAAQGLLDDHIAVSVFLDTLQDNTVREVQFNSLDFTAADGGGMTVLLKGVATGYNAVALQSERFKGNKSILNPLFSDLDLTEKGQVRFSFKAGLDSGMTTLKTRLEGLTFLYDMNESHAQ